MALIQVEKSKAAFCKYIIFFVCEKYICIYKRSHAEEFLIFKPKVCSYRHSTGELTAVQLFLVYCTRRVTIGIPQGCYTKRDLGTWKDWGKKDSDQNRLGIIYD